MLKKILFLVIFPVAGNNEKKNGARTGMGYCPNCVVTQGPGGMGAWALGLPGSAAGAGRGLGLLLGCGLCSWCTQPVFDPI